MTHPQSQVPKSLGLAEIVISRKATAIQISLQGLDQGIQPWVQDGAAGQIDDAVAAAAEVAHAQTAILPAAEGDQPAVAIAETTLIRLDRSLGMVDLPDPQQCLTELILLPVALGSFLKVLQCAATTVVGQDARRAASFR
jgi:hypothetical protein|tara:strand:+ start:3223 stop:3642 length:420 start_codon:yes stop_codon:yes gene_type:complete